MPTRRRFLQSGAALAATVSPRRVLGNQANKNSRLRILQIGVGGIGQLDRRELASHPMVEFTGFCDVDSNWLAEYSKPYPDAFKVTDYREAFAQHCNWTNVTGRQDTTDQTHKVIIDRWGDKRRIE